MHEIGQCLTTIRAVARLHGKTTSFVDGVVASVSTLRLLCVLAMQAVRLAVAVLLCYGGAFFIGHTIKLGDLILNCIALEVSSSVPQASLLMCLFSCAWWDACRLYDQHVSVLCVAVRPARATDKAAPHSAVPRCMMCRKLTV
jgi:hypothetical protein